MSHPHTPAISICIPTYEYTGQGVKLLEELFESIRQQDFKDFDVVISDHSLDSEIKNFCEAPQGFHVNYFTNDNGRGYQAANTNNVLRKATGNILKILYQDDLLVSNRALSLIYEKFMSEDVKWLMHGFCHTKDGKSHYRNKIPCLTPMMLYGQNDLGSPSCLAIKDSAVVLMDEELKLLIDTEWYYRLIQIHGEPTILKKTLVSNREHIHRVSSAINYDMRLYDKDFSWWVNRKEFNYVRQKHKS